jgi:hypothetical protein
MDLRRLLALAWLGSRSVFYVGPPLRFDDAVDSLRMNPILLGYNLVGVVLRKLSYVSHVLFRQNGKVIVLPTLNLPGVYFTHWN